MSRAPNKTLAEQADPRRLYELAVQQPALMVELLDHVGQELGGRELQTLREDFSGTAQLAATWVRSGPQRAAVAVDRDPAAIEYAELHQRQPLEEATDRLHLICSDVLEVSEPADAIVSLNFSHFIYKSRDQLLRYLSHVFNCLNAGGLFLLDAFGGPGAIRPGTDSRAFGDFTYLWEQASYEPLTSEVLNHIHFRFPDGSRLNRAYTYDWRLWSLVELRELLDEAGFTETAVCFEAGDGFVEQPDPDAEAWVAYLFAQKD